MTLTKKSIFFLLGAAFCLLGVFLLSRWTKLMDENLYQDEGTDPDGGSEEKEPENIKTDDSKESRADKTE